MRAEVLASGRKSPADLCDVELAQVINFVAKAITIPRLKIASVHFPEIRYRPVDKVKSQGLIAAWLGYDQASSLRSQVERDFMHFSQACIVKGDWQGLGHKLRPALDTFVADFPAVTETSPDFPTTTASDGLDLTRPCGRPWRLRTVVKQLNRRLDQWNLKPTGVELSPALRICLARQRYSKVRRVDEQGQQDAICALYKDVLYQKLTDDDDRLTHLVKHGIDHLNNRVHQIFR